MGPRVAVVQLNLSWLAGIEAVIRAQGRATSRPGGPKLDMYVLGDHEGIEDGVRFVRVRCIGPAAAARWQRRLFKYALFSQLDAFRSYDVVVMRYVPTVDLMPLALFARARARLVTVHHAKEADELLLSGHPVAGRVRALFERVQSPAVLRRVHGVVGVTDEIREYQLGKLRAAKPSATVSNGVDLERVAHTGFAPAGAPLQVAFVASVDAPWHGFDRLERSFAAYRGKRPIELQVVGPIAPRQTRLAGGKVTVRYHGLLARDGMESVLRGCTIGVSSLALHRKDLRQGALLKTREYIARGLPFVYGYEDVDVPDGAPFALRVPNSDDAIDVARLVDFAEDVSARPSLSREMRALAERSLDWGIKLEKLQRFAATVA